MSDEKPDIETVTRINPNKKYAFQFPTGTDEETRTAFEQTLETARKEGKNVYLEPGMKVIPLDAEAKVEVEAVKEEKKEEVKESEPKVTQEPTAPQQTQNQQYPQWQGNPFPNQMYGYGNPQPYNGYPPQQGGQTQSPQPWGQSPPPSVTPQQPNGVYQYPQWQGQQPQYQPPYYNPNQAQGPINPPQEPKKE